MIKFILGTKEDQPKVLGLGLSHENLDRLRAGKPIQINCTEILYNRIKSIGPQDQIFIFAGKDEDTMKADLASRFSLDGADVKDFR